MPIPWTLLLKTVPWTEVIASAPAVANGARKLWNSVSRKSPLQQTTEVPAVTSADAGNVAKLQAKIESLESTASELKAQMLASTELIRALADQNAELVKRVEASRVRLLWLSGATLVACLLALAGLALH